jgi:hypothetical protein
VTRMRGSTPCPRDPIGLSLDEASALIGVGGTLFSRMVMDGRMPAPRKADGRRIWDADEVIQAFRRLPRDLPACAIAVQDEDALDAWERVRV